MSSPRPNNASGPFMTDKQTVKPSINVSHLTATASLTNQAPAKRLVQTCGICKKSFLTGTKHPRRCRPSPSKQTVWGCPECGIRLPSTQREDHLASEAHAKSIKPKTCTLCEKTFASGLEKKHLSSNDHINRLPWTCTVAGCDHVTTMYYRKSHFRNIHPGETAAGTKSRSWKCKTCGRTKEMGCMHVYGGSALGWEGPERRSQ